MLASFITVAMTASVVAQDWAIKGDYTESCNCNVVCPCLFGSPPTQDYCEGSGLFEIKKGRYGDVSLDGVSFVWTFRMGNWIKYYVNEDVSDEQAKAVEPIMAALFDLPKEWKVLSSEKVPVSIERTATKVKFSVPASVVEIEMMEGRAGNPIKIENLPAPFLMDYTQFKSVKNSHKSEDKEFSYSGTNGFASKVDASSKK
jgi:hypothetical protein